MSVWAGNSTRATAESPLLMTRSIRTFSSLYAFQMAARAGELAIHSGQWEGRPPLVTGTGFLSCLRKFAAPC